MSTSAQVWHHGSASKVRWCNFRDKQGRLRFVFAYPNGDEAYRAYVFDGKFDRIRVEKYATFAGMRFAVARRAQA